MLSRISIATILGCRLMLSGAAGAQDTVQEAYWQLDEVREAAGALSRARSGRAACWPRMTVPGGAGVLRRRPDVTSRPRPLVRPGGL